MKKTFKIGEYVIGGIIEVVITNGILCIAFKDWDTKEVLRELKINVVNRYTENDIYYFLCDNGTPYHADMVWDYIERFWTIKIQEISLN